MTLRHAGGSGTRATTSSAQASAVALVQVATTRGKEAQHTTVQIAHEIKELSAVYRFWIEMHYSCDVCP
jgi:hypothetical protein